MNENHAETLSAAGGNGKISKLKTGFTSGCHGFLRGMAVFLLVSLGLCRAYGFPGADAVDVREYLPDGWQDVDRLDLREYIQTAINENARVFFPGSNDADNPVRYHVSPTIEVPEHHQLFFGPNHRIVRLPATGRLFMLNNHVRMRGAIIDGNKYNHWPEFEDLGKEGAAAVSFGSHCLIEDVVVYNNAGHGFSSRGHYNKIYRCRAENIGYIDVRHGMKHYAARWDSWSGDGFYLRGTGNLIKDSEAYDCIRWDFCSSHSGAKQNTYVDCRGGDINFRTYGFIDIEDADANNRLIRCLSPNGRIVVAISEQTEVINCMAAFISAWDRTASIDRYAEHAGIRNHGLLIDGNITTHGGIVIGGYWSQREEMIPGAASPIVTNNRMYKQSVGAERGGPGGGRGDYSFSVYAVDGVGLVSNNILFEYDDGEERGPGMMLYGVTDDNNQVLYGQWKLDLPVPELRYGYIKNLDQLQGIEPYTPWRD